MSLAQDKPALAQLRRRRFLDRVRAEIAPQLGPGPLGLAVSGGGDSLAMLHALAALAPEFGWQIAVATVDHRLRPEAAAEAQGVARAAAQLGLPHHVLVWHGASAAQGNLMDAARRARYGLLASWGADLGRVAVAHTADDQAETLLMGLARTAGLDGLCGLRPEWDQGGVRFVRPFLAVTRSEMQGFLQASGVAWVEDPTNDDASYERVRMRRALAGLSGVGITPAGLARVARHLAAVQADLRGIVAEAAARVLREVAGGLIVDRAAFAALPDEVARRLLRAALIWMSGAEQGPRAPALARFTAAVRSGRAAALSGCRVLHRGPAAHLLREPRALGPEVATGTLWDGRWQVTGPAGGSVRAVGADGLAQWPDWRAAGILREAALVTPGIWHGDRLIAAPILGLGAGHAATLTASFGLFLLSH